MTQQFRSIYEKRIFLQNNFLVYEPCRIKYESLSFVGRVSPKIFETTENDDYIVPKEHFNHQKLTYTPDWVLPARFSHTGKDIFIESKGGSTVLMEDIMKMGTVMTENPDLDIRFLLERDTAKPGKRTATGSYKSYKSKGLVTEWLSAGNIQYAIGYKIPDNWLNLEVINEYRTAN